MQKMRKTASTLHRQLSLRPEIRRQDQSPRAIQAHIARILLDHHADDQCKSFEFIATTLHRESSISILILFDMLFAGLHPIHRAGTK
jgi:hypothetical protein